MMIIGMEELVVEEMVLMEEVEAEVEVREVAAMGPQVLQILQVLHREVMEVPQ
jgi:hypothetical protein